jgi:hypothetical protein
MSYVRFLEADVYVYMDVSGYLVCCWCSMEPDTSFQAYSTQEMIDHLRKHQEKDDYVPDHVFTHLADDDELNFGRREPGGEK